MNTSYIDLHIHTTASDSLFTPQEVVEKAIQLGLAAIAIADHDTVAGVKEARDAARGTSLEVISAVELSSCIEKEDIHILGYLIDVEDSDFLAAIEEFQAARYERGHKIVEKLNELGIGLNMETVKEIAGEAVIGRPHVAEALVRNDYVKTYDEAFARYLGYHAPAYVPKRVLSPQAAVEMIHSVNGVAVLAHPGIVGRDDLIPHFVKIGIDGLEAFHSKHNSNQTQQYIDIAQQNGLIFTGGSDCHGSRKGKALIGTVNVPYSCLVALKRRQSELARPGNVRMAAN